MLNRVVRREWVALERTDIPDSKGYKTRAREQWRVMLWGIFKHLRRVDGEEVLNTNAMVD